MSLTQAGFLGLIVPFVGAGVERMWSGDACVALAGGERRTYLVCYLCSTHFGMVVAVIEECTRE